MVLYSVVQQLTVLLEYLTALLEYINHTIAIIGPEIAGSARPTLMPLCCQRIKGAKHDMLQSNQHLDLDSAIKDVVDDNMPSLDR